MDNEQLKALADRIDREVDGAAAAETAAAVEKELGIDGETVKGIFPTIVSFIKSFRGHIKALSERQDPKGYESEEGADAAWLKRQFAEAGYGKDDAERETAARGIAGTLAGYEQAKKDLARHIDEGGSRASWIRKRVEEGAEANGVNADDYAREIQAGLDEANEELAEIRFGNKEAHL
jgi:hypothetical protein